MWTLRKTWSRIDENENEIKDIKNNYLDRFEKLTSTVKDLEINIIDRIGKVKDELTDDKLFLRIIRQTITQTLNRTKKG
jgi:hypothetical protein